MGKILFFILTTIALVYCREPNATGPMILSGKIENPKTDSVSILDQTNSIHTIKLNKDDTFIDTFDISTGFYYLNHAEWTNVFLKPGFDLNLTINTKFFDESVSYNGKGAKENNFLAKKFLFEMSPEMMKLNTASYVFKLNGERFLKLTDSLYNVRVNRLKDSRINFDRDFENWELKNYELQRLYQLSTYESSYQFFNNDKDFKVPPQFPDAFRSLDLNDDNLLISPYYLMLVESYVFREARNSIKNSGAGDLDLEAMNIIDKKISNNRVRESLANRIGMIVLSHTKELDKVYEKLTSYMADKKQISKLKMKYEELKDIQKGTISPDFSFYDINNQHVTLSSLKGKLVYIDVWATWCAPCMVEIPALIQLEKDLENYDILFVSICMNDNKERWQKTVKEKKLGGIQIYSRSDSSSFFDDYKITGIPRYIILDRNGYIIDGNANRPTDPKLKEELLKLLAK